MVSQRWGSVVSILVLAALALCNVAASAPSEGSGRIDYVAKLNALVKRGPDESQNAEPFYRKAAELCTEPPAWSDLKRWPAELTPEQRIALNQWIDANSEALAELQLGTQKPHYWFQVQGMSPWDRSRADHLGNVRRLLFALVSQAKLRAADGNMEGALEDLLAGFRFGSDMSGRLLLVEQLVAIAVLGGSSHAAFQIVDRVDPNDAWLGRLHDGITDVLKDHDWLIDLKAEQLVTMDAIQRVYGGWPGMLDMKVLAESGNAGVSDEMASQLSKMMGMDYTPDQMRSSIFHHSPDELVDMVKKGYEYYETLVPKTPFQLRQEGHDFEIESRKFIDGNLLLYNLCPAVPNVSETSFRCRVENEALITVLVLLRYRNSHGVFPDDLQALVSAGHLAHLPMDPYSDKPLVYKRTGDDFTLYSIGVDLNDDGGRPSREWGWHTQNADRVFWPVQTQAAPEGRGERIDNGER